MRYVDRKNCDDSDSSTWIRFNDAQISTLLKNDRQCKTYFKGWYSAIMPIHPYQTTKGKIYFENSNKSSYLSSDIIVTNCGSFYVYRIEKQFICNQDNCIHPVIKSLSLKKSEISNLIISI
jgi:hypothetical protein